MIPSKKVWPLILVAFIALDAVLFFSWLHKNGVGGSSAPLFVAQAQYPEVNYLAGKNLSFKDLADYFTNLANRKGAAYAYEVLKAADIPPNIDMHLMGHVVGDILYKQKGADGIKICTQDFRNACSHSIVVGLLLEHGPSALPQISKACQDAPGGSGAYTMCFHGLGHGILAYTGYKLEAAIDMCKQTGTEAHSNREYIECVGGTVMEIIGGGFHNRELFLAQQPKYFKKDDPLYPCSSDFMPQIARSQCYTYLTPHLFTSAGASLQNPGPANFEKAFTFCDKLHDPSTGYRRACFGGFGKEFVVLAKNRDVRNIDKMTNDELQKVYDWCALAKDVQGVNDCVNTAASSIYWGGENDRGAVIRFCGLIPREALRSSCFENIIGAVAYYIRDPGYKESFCKEIPQEFGADCRKRLLGV